ncbi:MAG TPA: hypothetical protein DCZ07_01915, partial [Alphaproteobacteria bacterium]|nr:hypothetical protein [Alphaproteobacteria bacterium]
MARLECVEQADAVAVRAAGDWVIAGLAPLEPQLRNLLDLRAKELHFDLSGIDRLDTAGAWLIHRTLKALESSGKQVRLDNASEDHAALIERVAANDKPHPAEPESGNAFVHVVEEVGET